MNLSSLTLLKLCDELRPQIDRRLIRDVYLVEQHNLYLDLGDAGHLLLSAHPGRGRLLHTSSSPQGERTRLPWADRFLHGAGILDIQHVPNERIVHILVRKRDRLGTATDSRIICELIGRHANVIVTDINTDKILGSLRTVNASQNRVREIRPGKVYQPPPPPNGIPPQDVTPEHLTFLIEIEQEQRVYALQHHIIGLDPLIAQELLHISGLSEKSDLNQTDLEYFSKTLHTFYTAIPYYNGGQSVNDLKNRLTVCAIELQHTQPTQTYVTLSQAIEAVADSEVLTEALKGRQKNLEKDLKDRLANIEKKNLRIQADIDDAQNADEYEKLGNLLMSNISQIPPNVESVTLPDLFDTSNPDVVIALNPRRSAADNASDYLKRARKARKGAPILAKRLEAAESDRTQIQQYIDRLNNLQSESDLEDLRAELEAARLIKPPKKRTKANPKRDKNDIHPRRYRTHDGWLVLVGRNNTENDKLTKSATREDIFLHAHGCPGSHVILKREGRADMPSRRTLKEAASLAAYWSKARGANSVPVNYTEARYVQKPRGAPAGLVTIRNEKTIMVHPHELKREDAL